MGSCGSKQKTPAKSFAILRIPECIYINRVSSLVLSVSPSSSKKLPITASAVFLPDCLVAYLNERSIYLVGGHKSNKKLSKKCYHLDLASNSLTRIQSLPQAFAQAELIPDTSQLWLVTTDAFKIYSYTVKTDTWAPVPVSLIGSSLARLRDFSCCLLNENLMVVCGRYSKSQYSNDIYCVCIHKPEVSVFIFNLKFPGLLLSPKSICTKEYKVVGGGKCPNGSANTKFFIKPVNEDWNSVDCPHIILEEDYPAIVVQGMPVFISGRNMLVCFKDILSVFCIPEYEDGPSKVAIQENNTDKEATVAQDSKRQKTESEESEPVNSRSASELSGSYVLRAKILTPVNQTFRETISSYDSDFSSQKLYSDDENPQNEILDYLEDTETKTIPAKSKEGLNLMHQIHSIEVLLNYATVEQFMLFIADLFKIKNFRLPVRKPEKFSLYDLEGILKKLKFRLYPTDTFKLIIKSLDILFAMKNKIKKEERNFLKKIAGIEKKTEHVKKENLISAVGFRIKLAVIGHNSTLA